MLSSRISRISVGVACLVTAFAGAAASGSGSASADTGWSTLSAPPTYQEFEASTYVDVDGAYVVNGDEALSTKAELKKFYNSMVGPFGNHDRDGHEGDLIVNTVNGRDDKWSASQALNLTYCVSTKFGTRQADIVAAMNAGTALWENATSKVNFVYVPAQNGSCTTRNNNVVFSVEPVNTSQYIARAFFPSSAKSSRNVLVDDSIWSSGNWEPGDILGHELGHVLGFRHEHTRPEAGTCFEDNNWRPLTPYDSASIMHYPQCNGSSADLEFQASDATGVRALYGS
ncbi:M57 family metalloprotease [Pimelobacter simplex]|uniref:Peptidase M16 n=1 Tax=Nocardioides simplex TaxID=2045 RepID=A0A7J5E0Z2_NOCSI|nr:M57 family metalloprotease [Pimelobacter simplex]KAB2811941.1 peptidase M16 [Pimelobacter simplex]MCG8153181.1 peptidase M16 [Pimelobacter simplex]SFM31584.1 Dual-action HEIGH metallo-peptidase [Pimelobacter simplex]